MAFVAAAVGTAAVSGVVQAVGANRAANTQAAAGRAAIDEQRREFDVTQQNLAPYISAGHTALTQLQDLTTPGKTADIAATDPGYQFRLDQGTKAVTNSAAARMTNLSGATLKQLLEFGQNYASGEFQNTFNRLSTIAGFGAGATNVQAQTGASNAASIGNTITGIGNAQAAGQVGVANAISNAAGTAGNTLLLRSILNPDVAGGTPLSSANTGIGFDTSGD